MKKIIAGMMLLTAVAANANCTLDKAQAYMMQGMTKDAAFSQALVDCADPATSEINTLRTQFITQFIEKGFTVDEAVKMASLSVQTGNVGSDFVDKVVSFMSQGYSRDAAIQMAAE